MSLQMGDNDIVEDVGEADFVVLGICSRPAQTRGPSRRLFGVSPCVAATNPGDISYQALTLFPKELQSTRDLLCNAEWEPLPYLTMQRACALRGVNTMSIQNTITTAL
jgi:hypothetical protein